MPILYGQENAVTKNMQTYLSGPSDGPAAIKVTLHNSCTVERK